MRRRYQRELYVDRVNQIKRLMPDACIGVDVIVGFPGESDQHFLDTYSFLVELQVSYLHVFSYSERPNTLAASMQNQVPKAVRQKRSKMLRVLSAKKRHVFYESNFRKQKTILFEAENKEGYIQGFTENYVKVRMPWDPAFQNQTLQATLSDIDQKGMVRLAKNGIGLDTYTNRKHTTIPLVFLIKLTISGLVGITLTLRSSMIESTSLMNSSLKVASSIFLGNINLVRKFFFLAAHTRSWPNRHLFRFKLAQKGIICNFHIV